MYMEPAMSSAALLLVLLLLVCVAVIVNLRVRAQIMSNIESGPRPRGPLRRTAEGQNRSRRLRHA